MGLPIHAVTPCDTRQPRPAAQHPANVASREHSAQVMDLALQIADAEARGIIEVYSLDVDADGQHWSDTSQPPLSRHRHQEDIDFALAATSRAVRYIGLRNPDAFPWRFVRHPERPELVRFETEQ